jgi:thiamine-phosphate pyrophosphorylase
MLRYAITNRGLFAGSTSYRQNELIVQCGRWAAAGVDVIQVREKDLAAGELAGLVEQVMEAVGAAQARRESGTKTKVLVNSRADVAAAAGADGVHLTSGPGELTAEQVRAVFRGAGRGEAMVSVSCHRVEEVGRVARLGTGVDVILFGPVFEKRVDGEVVLPGVGLEALRAACDSALGTPVCALGGVTAANADECVAAGAAGVAGIRLFLARG